MFEFSKPDSLLIFPGESKPLIHQMEMILREFQEVGIRAVIGGGILRDLHLNRPYKDIDLFTHADDADEDKILSVLRQMGFACQVVVCNEATEYLSFTDVASVIEATHPSLEIPLQVIRMSANNGSPERLIERLDLGPCQIGMDYLGQFWVTTQFKADLMFKQFTITRSETRDIERSTKRFDRLALKYPEWELVIP